METKVYHDMALKAKLPLGPWLDEPDKMQWADPATGMPCLVVRNRMGAWCGYVGVDRTHPWHGWNYDTYEYGTSNPNAVDYPNPGRDVSVHGGLTFSSMCTEKHPSQTDEEHEAHNICHVPGPGEEAHVWWFGFDCGHSMDLVPKMQDTLKLLDCPMPRGWGEVYRDLTYVRKEVTDLARQLKAVQDNFWKEKV